MRALLPILPLLAGCLPPAEPTELGVADVEPVALAFSAVQPDQSLALLEDPALWLPYDAECPTVAPSGPGRERWQGGCSLVDGTAILGGLERSTGEDGTWVAGDGFQVIDPEGVVVVQLDGAVELVENGELIGIGASFTACGVARSCAAGPVTADLALTLFPSSGYPSRYDLTADGVVASPSLEPTSVYGAWSIDLASCGLEPQAGSVVLTGAAPYSLEFDGALACDACGALGFEGLPAGQACARWIE
ncbi:MAG: hypothetical protein ABIO70_20780 [Pseudomonadota bacterium]